MNFPTSFHSQAFWDANFEQNLDVPSISPCYGHDTFYRLDTCSINTLLQSCNVDIMTTSGLGKTTSYAFQCPRYVLDKVSIAFNICICKLIVCAIYNHPLTVLQEAQGGLVITCKATNKIMVRVHPSSSSLAAQAPSHMQSPVLSVQS